MCVFYKNPDFQENRPFPDFFGKKSGSGPKSLSLSFTIVEKLKRKSGLFVTFETLLHLFHNLSSTQTYLFTYLLIK